MMKSSGEFIMNAVPAGADPPRVLRIRPSDKASYLIYKYAVSVDGRRVLNFL
jgi:hypothetical protein